MKRRMAIITIAVLVLSSSLITLSCAQAPKAAKPEDFYKGNKIFLQLGTAGGDISGLMPRVLVPYLERYTGATITVLPLEKGTLETINAVWDAEPDGLHLGAWGTLPLMLNNIFNAPGVKYEAAKFVHIGGMQSEPMVFLVKRDGPYNSIADLQVAKNLKLGSTTIEGNITLCTMTVADILNLDAKVVTGLKGPTGVITSIMQGEVAGFAYPVGAAMVEIPKGQIKPLFIVANKRHSALPSIPAVTELVKLPADKLELVRIWADDLVVFRTIFGPPAIPKERVKFLEAAHSYAVSQPECQRELEQLAGYAPLDYYTGEEATKKVHSVINRQKELKERFSSLIERYRARL